MKIRDIAELASVLLQKHDIINTGVFMQTQDNQVVQSVLNGNHDLRLLVRCANLVIKEVACEYIPLLHKQKITASDGKIPYSAFEKLLLEIRSIKDEKGQDVSFFTLPDHVAIQDGSFEVSYTYIPTDKGFFDDLDFCGTKASDRIFAYGTAAEYCLINGNYDEALMWERRYKDALLVATRKNTEVVLPRRRWV
ncbi:MAG: hypothetical protein IJV77_06655 [Clostridia bacterium]|nr:hypothetical protein [Clostridia bacterium]